MDQVDGDTLDGLWEGITKGEPFTVCYDELFSLCYSVPGWKSWSLALGLAELLFWILAIYFGWKRIRGKDEGRHNTKLDDEDRLHKGQGRQPFK
jgi:hypothetical protein